MKRSIFCLAAMVWVAICSVSHGQVQPVGNDVTIDSTFDPKAPGDLFDRVFDGLAFDPSAREQLGITDDQLSQLKQCANERATWIDEEYTKRYREYSNPTDEQKMEMRAKVWDALYTRARAQIEGILLPHQIKILEGMAVEKVVDKVGIPDLLKSRWLQVELGIDDEQLARIRERAEKEAEILRASIEELKSKFVENVLSELTPSQREKVKELLPESKQEESKK